MVVVMVMAAMIVIMIVPLPMLQLLDDRAGKAAGTLPLQGGVGDVVIMLQHLFDGADDLPLAQAVLRLDVDMGRKRRDVGADR